MVSSYSQTANGSAFLPRRSFIALLIGLDPLKIGRDGLNKAGNSGIIRNSLAKFHRKYFLQRLFLYGQRIFQQDSDRSGERKDDPTWSLQPGQSDPQ